ncbi:MAG: SCO family protein [Alphaproteobacteria bacterium]|nr:SCO family protein [Alphaproteobacteria bacterium]MDE2162618.1 SCO family protein [Alphaproteobacteria bacterium]
MACGMRRALACLLLAVALTACSQPKKPWYGSDITGVMPKLSFTMTRANDSAQVTAKDYLGRIVLLYFGYTNCPDICPTTLANLSDMLEKLGPDASKVRVLFVTVDPNRDTLSVLKKYVAAFAPQMDGLRGNDNAIAALARRYRVAYSVTPASPQHPYTVTHSSAVFFFDQKGHARLVTLSTDDPVGLANDVKRFLD